MIYRTAPLCLFLLLAACSPNKDEKTPPPKLFEEQRNVLEQAKSVNTEQQKQDEVQRQAIEKQTQ
jgi:hypothetical protein